VSRDTPGAASECLWKPLLLLASHSGSCGEVRLSNGGQGTYVLSENPIRLDRDALVDRLQQMLSGQLTDDEIRRFGAEIDANTPHPDVSMLFAAPWLPNPLSAEAIIDEALAYKPVEVDLLLLDELKAFRDKVALRDEHALGPIGLTHVLEELYWSGYPCSPRNSVAFASAGEDGDHYSFLVSNNRIDENTPVILTWPTEAENYIVGATLREFLSFGMHCGYFQLLDVLEFPDANCDRWVDTRQLEADEQKLLREFADEFKLEPWTNRSSRFEELQKEYMPLLEVYDLD